LEHRDRSGEFKKKLLDRMERINGQSRGILKMIEKDRYCIDILIQIAAVRGALDKVALELFEDHSQHCLARALSEGGEAKEKAVDELMSALKRIL